MSLEFFYSEDFSIASDLDPVDQLTGDGTPTKTLVKKSGASLAATITAGNLQYYQFNGGFTKLGNTFTLSSSPAVGVQIVAPGLVALTFAAYDQNEVDGVVNPRVQEKEFYLGDPTECYLYTYTNLPQYIGIKISFVDMISGSGADSSWIQLASSSPTTGLALTYAATGVDLFTASLTTFGTITASALAGASSVNTANAQSYYVGDYVILNPGDGTQEIRKVKEKVGTRLGFFTNLDYSHVSGEDIHTMGRKFWAKVTIPENAADNQAFNFWNMGLRRQARNDSKV